MEERASNLPLGKEELRKLLSGLEKRTGLHSMLNVILCSGMSLDDALNIRLSDINYGNNQILLYDKYLARKRIIKLPVRVMGLISLHQNGHDAPQSRLYEISRDTADWNLAELSQEKLRHPVTWSGIRRSWAILAFENRISLKSMIETSGASAQQLSVWSLYKKDSDGGDSTIDLLSEIYR